MLNNGQIIVNKQYSLTIYVSTTPKQLFRNYSM